MDGMDEPATEQQLMHLKNFGFADDRPLTRMQAARLIRECRRNPARMAASSVFQSPHPQFAEREMDTSRPISPHSTFRNGAATAHPFSAKAGEGISEAARMLAYRLRHAVEDAKRALASTPDGPNVRANSVSSTTSRQEFWLDT